jgi:hypothetical protein
MKVLTISPDEQKAFWLILAAIYHLGAAGATKGKLQPTLSPRRPFRGPVLLWYGLALHRLNYPSLLVPLLNPPHQSSRLERHLHQ